MSWLARPSTRRRFRLSELVTFDHSPDAHTIGSTLRNFFYAHHSSLAADKCIGSGESENNRRAKYCKLTGAGRRQLEAETKRWGHIALAITGTLEAS